MYFHFHRMSFSKCTKVDLNDVQGFLQCLSAMSDGVMTLEWSTCSEWILMTGGRDGAIRFWDIRRAGCFRVLDQSQCQLGRRPPFLENTSKKVCLLDI